MSTVITSTLSKKNKWWIPKYRYLELKYHCLQYPDWLRERSDILGDLIRPGAGLPGGQIEWNDPTGNSAIRLTNLESKISRVEKIAKMSDEALGDYILLAVTEGLSFVNLKTIHEIPCERDMYYDRYRKFFYILSASQEKHLL